MAISEMKKITLLAEIEYLDAMMLSLQSDQAVEIIPTTSDIQRELLNQYQGTDEEDAEESSIDLELFNIKSNENEINRLTNTLDDLEEYIEFVEETIPSPGFFAKLSIEKETYSLYELEDYMKDIDVRDLVNQAKTLRQRMDALKEKKEGLIEEREFLNRWRSLSFNPKETKDFTLTEVIVGAVDAERNNEMREALSHFDDIYLKEIHYSEEESVYLVIVPKNEVSDVEQTLIRHRFERLNYTHNQLPEEELKRNKSELEDVEDKMNHIQDNPEKATQLLKDLKLAEEYLFNVRERKRASEDVLISEHLFILSGWIEEDMIETQVQNVKDVIGENNIFTYIDDVKESEVDEVPIKYDNPQSTSAFESVVSMFSVPKYNEMDPTKFVQPFSILFFGMMTADAGYGLLGLIAIFIALKFLNLSESLEKNLKFFGQLMIGTTLAGLFFGSFFGFELPFQVMSLNDQILEIMIISIGIGIVHLLLGLFLNTVLNNRKKDYSESFVSGYSWILILLAAVGLAVNAFLGGPGFVNKIALAVVILSLVVTIIISIVANENKVDGVVNGIFSLFDITGYIGDVISYTRLTALGIASANIAMAFNLVIGLLPVWARLTIGVLLFVALHLFNMFIAMISGYVHTLRLNYVEFFGKFYEGGGREFEPIPMLQKHILIETSTTQ